MYWDVLTPSQYAARRREISAETERRIALDERTLDEYRPGEQQSEIDHNQQGEGTISGEWQGRKFRHAENGGWFSFNLKVMPNQPVELLCAYWGGETGNRSFDILVDGKLLATQTLNQDQPGVFFDKIYSIPEELTRGKQIVEVRFQAHPENTAGGLYGIRTLRGRSK